MGILDMMMFSINPGYDYQHGAYAIGEVDERMNRYRRRNGIIPLSVALPLLRLRANASTAITANPVRQAWMWD